MGQDDTFLPPNTFAVDEIASCLFACQTQIGRVSHNADEAHGLVGRLLEAAKEEATHALSAAHEELKAITHVFDVIGKVKVQAFASWSVHPIPKGGVPPFFRTVGASFRWDRPCL